MAYASPMKIANGLVLDFTVDNADTAADTFLGLNASGEVTKFASVPRARVSGGGNITEATSSVLSITGGTAAVLTSGLTIQVLQAGVAQSGYLSTTDWNTFNNKLGTSLTSAYIYVGNGSNVATGVAISGDITISNAGVVAIASGVIVNADINASAAIAVSKLAAVTASRVLGSDGSGFIQALDTATYPSLTELAYVKGVTSAIQTQLNNRLSVTLSSPSNGDVITYNGSAWVNSPSSTGVPTGGTTAQILRKIDNTNYNTEWHTLVAADITDVSSTAAELNKLSGVTTTATQFNFLNTLSGDVQAQLAAKLSTSLTQNYMIVGDASNIAVPLAPGTNGYVLTSVSGVPTWVSPGVGGTVTSVAASGGTTGMSFTGSPITTTGTLTLTGTLALANGGTGASLADPGADRIMFWDDSAGAVTWLTAGNGTTITTTTLSAGGTLSSDITFSADGLAHDFIYTSIGPGSSGQFKVYVDATSSILLSGATSIGGPLTTTASGTSASGMNIPHGTAPSAPVNGDFWSTTGGFYGRVNGVTVGPFGTGFTLSNGNGTTANGSAVDLGGTITANQSFTWGGNYDVQWGDIAGDNIEARFRRTSSTNANIRFYTKGNAGYIGALNLSANGSSTGEAYYEVWDGSTAYYAGYTSTGYKIDLTGTNATGDTYYRDSGGLFQRLPAGTNGHVLTLTAGIPSWAAPSGGGGALSALTAATGTNTIDNAAYAQEWQWGTLSSGTGLLLSSSSTAAASNTNTVFRVNQTGANATSTQTTYSGYFSNTKTGTSNTNVALYATASGATAGNNYAIRTAGSVEITGSASQVPLYVRANASANGVQVASDGFTFNPIVSSNTGLGSTALRWGNSYLLRLYLGQAFPGSTETLYTLPNNSTALTSEIIDNRLSSARTVSYTLNGTISRQAFTLVEAPTSVAGSVATTTITNAYTLYVQDLPTAGSNLTYTNKWTAGFAGTVEIGGNLRIGTSSVSGNKTISAVNSTSDASLTLTAQGAIIADVASSAASFQVLTTNDRVVINPAGFQLIGEKVTASAVTQFLVSGAAGISGATSGQNLLLQAGGGYNTGVTNGGHTYIMYGAKNSTGTDGNIGIATSSVANWQSMERGVFLGNRGVAPTTGIANGVALFAEDSNSSSEFYVMPESGAKVNISGLFEPVTESGTSFTLNETHRNKIVLCSNSGAITVTVNTGKAAGWNCMLVATHATGTISLSASSTTINGVTATTTQFETLSIVHYGSENYLSKLG